MTTKGTCSTVLKGYMGYHMRLHRSTHLIRTTILCISFPLVARTRGYGPVTALALQGEYISGCLGQHGSGLSVSTALALSEHSSGSLGTTNTALALQGNTALVLQVLYSFGPTLKSTAGFSESPKSTKHFTENISAQYCNLQQLIMK